MSYNDLGGFDMVWAITQNTVNSQLSWLQELDIIPKKVLVGNIDDDGLVIGGTGEDEAIMLATVDFDTGKPKSAKLIINFESGNISFYSGFGKNATIKKQPIKGWKLVFNVDVNIGQIAHEHIAGNTAVPKEIQDILTNFDSSMFSIQNIFLDFQNSDMANYDTIESIIHTDNEFVKQNFATSIGAWISSKKGSDNPYILGYPVSRKGKTEKIPAILEPTGANLSTHSFQNGTKVPTELEKGLSTLNFLLVTQGRKITDDPSLYGPGAGVFNRNLVTDNNIDGKGIISKNTFFDQYLQKVIVKPFETLVDGIPDYVHHRQDKKGAHVAIIERSGVQVKAGEQASASSYPRAKFIRSDNGWTYNDHVRLDWHESGSTSHDRESEQKMSYDIEVSMQPDAHKVPRLTLDIHGSLYRYEWDQVNHDIPPFKNNVYLGKGWASAMLTWGIRLQFIAGADGKLTITKQSNTNPPVKHSGTGGIYKVADFFTDLLNLHGINDDWRQNSTSLKNIEGGIVADLLKNSTSMFDNAMTKIVMPARSQFFYKNLTIDANSDVEIDFAYKSEA